MSNKRQLTLHFDADVAAAIEVEAKKRGLNLSRAANDALRRALLDETGEALADTVKSRLDRLDKRDATRARELALIKEIVLLFVRFWFEYSGALPDDDPDASANADIRFQGSWKYWPGRLRDRQETSGSKPSAIFGDRDLSPEADVASPC